MGWLHEAVPHVWQWIALFATLIGAALAVWAALSARGAKEQAREAKEAALGWGMTLQLTDLLNDVQELQMLLAKSDFEGVAWKASMLRGRIARLKSTSYNRLEEINAKALDRARDSFETISDVALNRKLKDETKLARIHSAFADAFETLNQIIARHRSGTLEYDE